MPVQAVDSVVAHDFSKYLHEDNARLSGEVAVMKKAITRTHRKADKLADEKLKLEGELDGLLRQLRRASCPSIEPISEIEKPELGPKKRKKADKRGLSG